jgi:hypothetical protein
MLLLYPNLSKASLFTPPTKFPLPLNESIGLSMSWKGILKYPPSDLPPLKVQTFDDL